MEPFATPSSVWHGALLSIEEQEWVVKFSCNSSLDLQENLKAERCQGNSLLLWHDSWHPDESLISKKHTQILFPRYPSYISATYLLNHLSKQRQNISLCSFSFFILGNQLSQQYFVSSLCSSFFSLYPFIFLLKSCTPPYDIKNFCKAMNFPFWINLSISILSKKFFSFSHHSTKYNQLHIERAMHP